MNSREKVLSLLLGTEDFISGEEIGRRLGISRGSVWKAVSGLRDSGFEISSVTNRGYRLVSNRDILTADSVSAMLDSAADGFEIEVRSSVESTNTELKAAAEDGKKEGTVLIAQEQTGGRGRLGRSFASPVGTGIYMSLLLRPKISAQEALFITTAAAAAVSEAIEAACGIPVLIKWVNDIYVGGKKVCGILTEASVDFESGGMNYAVCGIGINVSEPAGGFPPEISEIAGALYKKAPPEGIKAKLCAEVLGRFMGYYRRLPEKDFMPGYRARSMLDGRHVRFICGNTVSEGVVEGIDDGARLLVRQSDGTLRAYSSGEAQLLKS